MRVLVVAASMEGQLMAHVKYATMQALRASTPLLMLVRSSTCAGLEPELRNPTPDYKFCSHVAFRGALGYRGTSLRSAVGPIAAIKQSAREVRASPTTDTTATRLSPLSFEHS
jgi:hypothetical protein